MRRDAMAPLAMVFFLVSAGAALAAPLVEAVARARHDLDLGFTVRGRVAQVLVQPGARVDAGAVLVRLDDRDGAAAIRLYEIRAASTIEVESAEAEWRLAENEARRIGDAMERQGAAPFEVERARLEAKRRMLAHEFARQRREEARLQLEQARLVHERYELRAPIAGVVEEVVVEAGEMVEEVRPVVRLVATDPLRVDAPAPLGVAAGLTPGAPAWVVFKSSGAMVEGRVVHVASIADPGSETRLVRIDVPNPGGEPAGSHVAVSFVPPASTPTKSQ